MEGKNINDISLVMDYGSLYRAALTAAGCYLNAPYRVDSVDRAQIVGDILGWDLCVLGRHDHDPVSLGTMGESYAAGIALEWRDTPPVMGGTFMQDHHSHRELVVNINEMYFKNRLISEFIARTNDLSNDRERSILIFLMTLSILVTMEYILRDNRVAKVVRKMGTLSLEPISSAFPLAFK